MHRKGYGGKKRKREVKEGIVACNEEVFLNEKSIKGRMVR